MIDEARGRIDYQECGSAPTVVLVPVRRMNRR